jgi:branched-chain amino acid transport system substrate-binding protein
MKTLLIFLVLLSDSFAMTKVSLGIASNFSEPSSSSSNPYGDYFRNGIKLALEDSGQRLMQKKIAVELQEFDYGTNQIKVLEAAKLAQASLVIGVIGYNFSSHALIAAPLHQNAKLPMITPSATADRLSKMGQYIHLGCFDNSFMGTTLADVASKKLKAKRAAIVVAADCAYCQDLARAFEERFKKIGGAIVHRQEVLESDKDFTSTIEALKQQDFDVILVPNQELNSARIISALLQAKINRPFLGGDGWGNVGDEFFSVIGKQEFKGYSVSHWHVDQKNPRSTKFFADYLNKFGKGPNDTSVLAYDTTLYVIEALLKTHNFSREGLEQALQSITYFQGVTGEFHYNKNSAPKKSLVLLEVNRSKFKVVEQINPIVSKR